MTNQHTYDEKCGTYGLYSNIPQEVILSPKYRIVDRKRQGYRVEWIGEE